MSTPSFGKLHNRLEKIIEEASSLRLILWNAYAEESRHPKPKVMVYVIVEFGTSVLAVCSTKEQAEKLLHGEYDDYDINAHGLSILEAPLDEWMT